MPRFQLVLAGLMGAAGVILAALAAHKAPGAGLDGAAHLLLLHAVAVLATAALADAGRLSRPLAILAAAGWQAGSLLFAAAIALPALAGPRLFPYAAPIGGSTQIVAWLLLAVAAAAAPRRA